MGPRFSMSLYFFHPSRCMFSSPLQQFLGKLGKEKFVLWDHVAREDSWVLGAGNP